MKGYFILCLIFLFFASLNALASSYFYNMSNGNNIRHNTYQNGYFPKYRLVYNPYNPYNSYYQYKNANKNNPKRLERIKKIRKLNQTKRRLNNYLGFFDKNKNNSGTMTGYSLPVTSDIYKQIGITPYNQDPNNKIKSTNCDTDLFSSPSGDEAYLNDGRFYRKLRNTSGSAGVTIIYD